MTSLHGGQEEQIRGGNRAIVVAGSATDITTSRPGSVLLLTSRKPLGLQWVKFNHLATELIDSGWSLKHIHRTIVRSATYRQKSLARTDAEKNDPENDLLFRQNVRRVSAETLRDAMYVRSVFLIQKRTVPLPFLQPFDLPETTTSCARREVTTVAPQAINLLNSPFAVEMARSFWLGEWRKMQVMTTRNESSEPCG